MSSATSSARQTAAVQVALVTGAARRIGAGIARCLHQAGFNLALHCHTSKAQALQLADELNADRANSARVVTAKLGDATAATALVADTISAFDGLDLLVNNASVFFPTALGSVTESQWDTLMDSNLKGPFWLCQAAAPWLARGKGAIINIGDIHGLQPLKGHVVYCASKAGLLMLTRSLARELAPDVRVNAVCPGSILWPQPEPDDRVKRHILARVPLGRQGEVADIAEAVRYLAVNAAYVTGQILTVDGGRSLSM